MNNDSFSSVQTHFTSIYPVAITPNATHSSILAWEIPWIEEPGRLQGHRRVRHNWETKQQWDENSLPETQKSCRSAQTSWNAKSSGHQNSSWAISNPKRWCCESAALNMSANLKNSAVATGLEKVSFHSKRQCQRLLKLPYNCTHLIC